MIFEVLDNQVFNYFMNIFVIFFIPIFVYVVALSFIK